MPDKKGRMTRADLFDWIRSHGCIPEPLPEHKAHVIMITNPRNDREAWINLPINNTEVNDYTIFLICNRLGIPIPTCANYMRDLHNRIENEDYE